MTHLLTIALICAAMYGKAQNDTIIFDNQTLYPVNDNWNWPNRIIEQEPSEPIQLLTKEWLIETLNEYATACYNDSVKVEASGYAVTPNGGGRIKMKDWYYHPEPTFSGFIKWLNKWK